MILDMPKKRPKYLGLALVSMPARHHRQIPPWLPTLVLWVLIMATLFTIGVLNDEATHGGP